jgi:hypothetical protein
MAFKVSDHALNEKIVCKARLSFRQSISIALLDPISFRAISMRPLCPRAIYLVNVRALP